MRKNLFGLTLSFFLILVCSSVEAVVASGQGVIHLQVLASFGPDAYPSGSLVSVMNAKGELVGAKKTNKKGSAMFHFNQEKVASLPLLIKVRKGALLEYDRGKVKKKSSFTTQLEGVVESLPVDGHVISYVDLISTLASKTGSGSGYANSYKNVRKRFGLPDTVHPAGLRHKNVHLSWALAKAKAQRTGGHDGLVSGLAMAITDPQVTTGINPELLADKNLSMAMTSSGDSCSAAYQGASESPVIDVGAKIAVNLMEHFGVPEGVGSAVIGFLLPSVDESKPTLDAIHEVSGQLACVSQDLAKIENELAQLQFQVSVSNAVDCGNSVLTQYHLYEGLVEQADGDASALARDNPVLVADLPQWNNLNTSCGASINNMLFGSSGSQAAAWSQLNKIYQSSYPWYSPVQVDKLRSFLSYWSALQANQVALYSEYNKYNKLSLNTDILLGSGDGQDPGLCKKGATPATPTLCVWRSNINSAMPESLLSDEIGSWQSHRGYMALPAGISYPSYGDTASARSSAFNMVNIATNQWGNISKTECDIDVGQVYFNFDSVVSAALAYHTGGALNPAGLANYKEYWWNPQVYHGQAWTGDEADVLSGLSDGISAAGFFADQINANPYNGTTPAAWGSTDLPFRADILNRSGAGFVGSKSWLLIKNGCPTIFERDYETITGGIALLRPDIGQPSGWENHFKSNPPTAEALPFGALLYRNWWQGSSDASSYTPPQPPQ